MFWQEPGDLGWNSFSTNEQPQTKALHIYSCWFSYTCNKDPGLAKPLLFLSLNNFKCRVNKLLSCLCNYQCPWGHFCLRTPHNWIKMPWLIASQNDISKTLLSLWCLCLFWTFWAGVNERGLKEGGAEFTWQKISILCVLHADVKGKLILRRRSIHQ